MEIALIIKDVIHSVRGRLLKFIGTKHIHKQNELHFQQRHEMMDKISGIADEVHDARLVAYDFRRTVDKDINAKLDRLYEIATGKRSHAGWWNKQFVSSHPNIDFANNGAIDRSVLQALGRRVRSMEGAFEQLLETIQRERQLCNNDSDFIDPIDDSAGGDNMVSNNNQQGGGK